MTPGLISNIRQNGYVVRDVDEAIAYWAGTCSVRPFHVLRRFVPQPMNLRGQPVQVELSIAVACVDGFQIELIQQHNDAPSLYREHLQRAGPGLHHVGSLTEDYEGTLARFQAAGHAPVQTGLAFGCARYAYFDLGAEPGAAIEIIELCGALAQFFQRVETACRNATADTPDVVELSR
ncbi:MAG: VOC family protein [Nevskiales bacterium]